MRQIIKQPGHEGLQEWMSEGNPNGYTYDDLRNPLKDEVKGALIEEQHGLCAYCTQRITNSAMLSHIEHVRPQNLDEDNTLGTQTDYANLVASCPGDRDLDGSIAQLAKPKTQQHCGHAKGDWYEEHLFVDPRTPAANTSFSYKLDGKIEPATGLNEADELAAVTTIEKLNLSSVLLKNNRYCAIIAVLRALQKRHRSASRNNYVLALQDIVNSLKRLDESNRLRSFQPVLISALQHKIAQLQYN